MKRSGSVTASAIISIIGSLGTLLLGIGLVISAIVARSNPQLREGAGSAPFDVTIVLLVEGGVLLAFGVFGIVSAIGLLRLKNWARICFLIFGGLLCAFSIMAVIGSVMAAFIAPGIMPPEQRPPEGFFTVFLVGFSIFWLLLCGLSVWWLIYFTRPRAKEQFMNPAEAAAPRRGPLSVTIIAWLLAVGGCFGGLALFVSYPVMFFGMVFTGWTARAIILLWSAASIAAGIGMLRWRAPAHTLALTVYGFGLLTLIANVILPGAVERMRTLMLQMNPQLEATSPLVSAAFVRFSGVFGILAVAVPVWFLITRRQAFLDACHEPPPADA